MLMNNFKGLETDHRVGLVTLIIALKTKVKSIVMQSRGVLKTILDLRWGPFSVNATIQLTQKNGQLYNS